MRIPAANSATLDKCEFHFAMTQLRLVTVYIFEQDSRRFVKQVYALLS